MQQQYFLYKPQWIYRRISDSRNSKTTTSLSPGPSVLHGNAGQCVKINRHLGRPHSQPSAGEASNGPLPPHTLKYLTSPLDLTNAITTFQTSGLVISVPTGNILPITICRLHCKYIINAAQPHRALPMFSQVIFFILLFPNHEQGWYD